MYKTNAHCFAVVWPVSKTLVKLVGETLAYTYAHTNYTTAWKRTQYTHSLFEDRRPPMSVAADYKPHQS